MQTKQRPFIQTPAEYADTLDRLTDFFRELFTVRPECRHARDRSDLMALGVVCGRATRAQVRVALREAK